MGSVRIVAIGSELTRGQVVDTNGSRLASEIALLGLDVDEIRAVPDTPKLMRAALLQAAADSEIVIVTGGLGPTSDDLTREVIADTAQRELAFSETSWNRIQAYLEQKGRIASESNRRQCWFPVEAEVFENRWGTADPFITRFKDRDAYIIALPGVPREMLELFGAYIKPWLVRKYPAAEAQAAVVLKCFGLSESYIGNQVESCLLPDEIEVAYRAHFPEVWVTLRGSAGSEELLDSKSDEVASALGTEHVFSRTFEDTLASVVGRLIVDKNQTLALAESCTGGLVSHQLVSSPGASKYLRTSVVAYSNEVKQQVLGVRSRTIEDHGAVSSQTAVEMARGVRSLCGADIGVSVTGIAGPDGGSAEKPVGTVWFGLDSSAGANAVGVQYCSERNMFRSYCSCLALDLIRRFLIGYDLDWERK